MIYLDSSLVIHAVEGHPVHGEAIAASMMALPGAQLCISPRVWMECLGRLIRDGNMALRGRFEAFFDTLHSLDMPEAAHLQAGTLRARFGLKSPDALHLACALQHGCSALWTNDDRLAKASHGLALNVLAS